MGKKRIYRGPNLSVLVVFERIENRCSILRVQRTSSVTRSPPRGGGGGGGPPAEFLLLDQAESTSVYMYIVPVLATVSLKKEATDPKENYFPLTHFSI